ncbi:SMI1/KNR4 family protein [Actinokineospora auranticolor]|uniref:Cell wall assembly regulator SMI1 n=1 Tax=Actinokineospora auranticolor TaxID=155976 RepID=A0A2S6GD48_9PSEU|nr:SMI1/KNR4 family protein [Actinokineospora auranticolor]PPK63165.1 cell wall assembly regulator SMI1 [Actinokineospora auranticolor]
MTGKREELINELVRIVAEHAEGGPKPHVWQVVNAGGPHRFGWFPHSPHGYIAGLDTDVLRNLERELRAPGDSRRLTMQVTLDADGNGTFDHTFDLWTISPPQVVLDPDYTYPNRPFPGMPRPEAATPTDAPTDPVALREIQALVDEFAAQYDRVKGRPPEFGRAVTEEELRTTEAALGARLPEDVRALYRLVGADHRELGLLGRYSLLDLDDVVDQYEYDTRGVGDYDRDGVFTENRTACETGPAGHVRRLFRDDWWVEIGRDGAGLALVADLDPGPEGRSGQLLVAGRGVEGTVEYVAESVTALLRSVVEAVRADRVNREHPSPGHLGAVLAPANQWYQPSHLVGDRALTDVLAELPAADVQQLYLIEATDLDLTALSATPRLRELYVNRAGRVTVWLPPGLESLSLQATEADLTLLKDHRALWDLTVRGVRVRATDLPASLVRLDLSEAEVDDIDALADLDLRVLILNWAQWAQLTRVPKRLAAAQSNGDSTLAEVATWTARLRGAE